MTRTVAIQKQEAAEAAVALVRSGMALGLGHGSTVQFALEALAAKINSGELIDLICIPASKASEAAAKKLGIPLGNFEEHTRLELTIDGADEVDPEFNLIKGGGGALLREKMLAQASERVVIIVDAGKLSPKLGSQFALPVEALPFGWRGQVDFLATLGGEARLRTGSDGKPVLSDQGNYLSDCYFGPIEDLADLARQLEARAGLLEHGLFLGLATDVFVGGDDGVEHHRVARAG
ncbi:MAG: ribose 5-phosphate isomerase A [Chloroflexi bacterium]|nr:ribose 5-phosphate isomerase A [Chloroflexota bacterium]MQC26727.1 ribose 5-phosphate isomerase A [Chloroflexota bacterium]